MASRQEWKMQIRVKKNSKINCEIMYIEREEEV